MIMLFSLYLKRKSNYCNCHSSSLMIAKVKGISNFNGWVLVHLQTTILWGKCSTSITVMKVSLGLLFLAGGFAKVLYYVCLNVIQIKSFSNVVVLLY